MPTRARTPWPPPRATMQRRKSGPFLLCLISHPMCDSTNCRFFPVFWAFDGRDMRCPLGKLSPQFCPCRAAFSPPLFPRRPCQYPFISGFSPHDPLPVTDRNKRLSGCPLGADNLPNWDPTAMARSQELAHLFQQPDLPAHRHYEICRLFYESTPADEIAKRFHLHSDSVRAIVRDFARQPDVNSLFPPRGPALRRPRNAMRSHERACELRRQGDTLAEIRAALELEGFDVSESYLFRVLQPGGLDRKPATSFDTATGRVRERRFHRARDIADVRSLFPRRRTATPHQGRRPLLVPSPVAGP